MQLSDNSPPPSLLTPWVFGSSGQLTTRRRSVCHDLRVWPDAARDAGGVCACVCVRVSECACQ